VLLDPFPIAVFLHKLPYSRSIIVRSGRFPVLSPEILDCGKWQVKGELIPEGQDGMIIALVYKSELRSEGERAAVTGIAQSMTAGAAAAKEIHGPFAAACKEYEQE